MIKNDVTTLSLPDGGTLDIPLPGSDAHMAMRAGSLMAANGVGGKTTLMIGIVLGIAIGVGATAWYMRDR